MTLGWAVALIAAALVITLMSRSRDERVSMPVQPGPVEASKSVRAELAAGRKIQAIKLYREEHGVGLKEAKDAVEALQRGQ